MATVYLARLFRFIIITLTENDSTTTEHSTDINSNEVMRKMRKTCLSQVVVSCAIAAIIAGIPTCCDYCSVLRVTIARETTA